MFAKLENGVVVEYPILSVSALFPDTSFPENPKDADLPDGYVRVYAVEPPSFDATTQTLSGGDPVFDGTKWVTGFVVRELSQLELDEQAQQRATQTAEARRQAYHTEADPLFFKAQRGEATMDDWLAKVAEIKARIF